MFVRCCRCNFLRKVDISLLGSNINYLTVEASSENSTVAIEKAKADLKSRVRLKKKPTTDVISQKLSDKSKERAVPSTKISRMFNYGGLVASLGLGAITESVKKQVGLSSGNTYSDNSFLSQANVERIVSTLCKVRGAALKFGQMLSIQDNNFIPKEVQQLFDRVRANADFMPQWQTEKMLSAELGNDWRNLFKEFNIKPFAAASIGQVHQAVTLNNIPVAVKIQYPGVAESIDSDIDTLLSILIFSKMLPEGLFLEQAADVARKELSWEVDYNREAQSSAKFKELLDGDDDYFIAECFPHLSTKRILTTELLQGIPLDEVAYMDQNTRNRVSMAVLRLCLRELFEFRFMQTDPNWSNFFYNKETDQLCLLDFGASRAYNKSFVDTYINVIDGAARCDRAVVESLLTKLGFQTGYESKTLIHANVEAVMVLGKPFAKDEIFDFTNQDITRKIKDLIPTMLRHRLTSPPEESYSLHRKLSGAFLLCTKLNAKINCYNIFRNIYESYDFK